LGGALTPPFQRRSRQVEGGQHFVGVIGFAVDTDLAEADVVTVGVVFDGMF
jgi:hypothetical protein